MKHLFLALIAGLLLSACDALTGDQGEIGPSYIQILWMDRSGGDPVRVNPVDVNNAGQHVRHV
ncbi:MAG: hypothetical protein SH809_11000, partial [Rhodothermales bacterium]|nr:hypothetical protein [Rhodothermales bacterium]